MRKSEVQNNQSGFTLPEILVSIVLLSIVISLVISLLPNMGNMNNKNEESLNAVNVSNEILLKYKNQKIEHLLKNEISNPLIIKENYKNFDVVISVTTNPDISGKKETLYKIKVEVIKADLLLSTTYGYIKK